MNEQKKKIFITGATGFLGRHFIKDSANDHFSISILVRDKKSVEEDPLFTNIKLIEGDINHIENFAAEIQQCDYFLHIAGEKRDIALMQDVNVKSMHKILPIISGTRNLKFIYISSCGVYGIYHHPENALSEDKTCYPENSYEKTKLDAEKYLVTFALNNSLKYLILRPSNVFGEGDNSLKLLNLMRNLKKGNFFFIKDHAMANYVYVKYVSNTILYFLRNDKFDNQIYNINSPLSLREFIDVLCSELKIERKYKRLPQRLIQIAAIIFEKLPRRFQILDSEKYFALTNTKWYSNEKLKAEFFVNESESIKTGIHSLVEWYRNKNLL